LDIGIVRQNVVAVSGYTFESGETEDVFALQWGATNGNQFILWLSEEDGNLRSITFGDLSGSHKNTKFDIVFNTL
jgi:hypothetical protein